MGGGGLIIGGGDCGQSQTLDLALVVGSESVIGFRVYIGVLYIYMDNGKEHGNCYNRII